MSYADLWFTTIVNQVQHLRYPVNKGLDGKIFNAIFTDRGINRLSLSRLDSVGLVKFTSPFLRNNIRFFDSCTVHLRYRESE
jgi:hypothetical protein